MAGTVYLVTNNLNGKQYVGQTIVASEKRGHGKLLTAAYKKHGKTNFSYEPICKNIDSRPTLNFLEKFWIKVMDSRVPNGYNIEHGGSTKDKVSQETREKLRQAHTGRKATEEHKRNIAIAQKNLPDEFKQLRASFLRKHKITPETIEKIRLGNLGKFVSEETKAKIRAARSKQVITDAQRQKLSEAAKRQWARQKGAI